jgi:2-dehydro-3-deoxyphosphogluconate aldolase/(4S)-4-hydroxy-2-oxoglutarate aldolase
VFGEQLVSAIGASGIIAVLVVDNADSALPLSKALMDGGVDSMELTLRTPAALEALEQIRKNMPQMRAGVGTILTVEQVRQVKNAGAAFGVAPGCNPRILAAAKEVNLPFAPGIATPSDIEQALEFGCDVLKFFPAEPSGGMKYLKSIAAPYAHLGLKYVPLGGVSDANVGSYASDKLILAVGGSWLAPRDLINQGNWKQITDNASKARSVIDEARKAAVK